MRIINPIYDVAFKYLMEDTEIARKLIGKIIGEDIKSLASQPQEITGKSEKFGILIFRLDFKATILTESGEYKTVLIELQKAKMYDDLLRFRNYLAENYRKKVDVETALGIVEEQTLPITTIYFLGFPLPKIETSLLKINREYIDLVSGKKLEVKTDFVEKLTHDSFVILITELPPKERTELEGILKVFNQNYQLDSDARLIEIDELEYAENELFQEMFARLQKGATDGEVLKRMQLEDEVESTIEKHIRDKEKLVEKVGLQDEALKTKDKALKTKDQALKTKDEALKIKDEALKTKDEELENQQKLIEELKKQLKDRKE